MQYIRKNSEISMAKLWIFLWYIENYLPFSKAHKTMICCRNKKFLMPYHEETVDLIVQHSVFLIETSISTIKLRFYKSFHYSTIMRHLTRRLGTFIFYLLCYLKKKYAHQKEGQNQSEFYQGSTKMSLFSSCIVHDCLSKCSNSKKSPLP